MGESDVLIFGTCTAKSLPSIAHNTRYFLCFTEYLIFAVPPSSVDITMDTTVAENEEKTITCQTTSADPGSFLKLYQDSSQLLQVYGTDLSFDYTASIGMNGNQYSCSATSSNPMYLDYTVTSSTETLNVLCKW